uniref:Uncharacterized protein n=1 Tax=Brassica campestris TaxID=3711 RepID=M4FBV2_BRACM
MKKHLKWLNKSAVKSIRNDIAYVEGDNYYGAKATTMCGSQRYNSSTSSPS